MATGHVGVGGSHVCWDVGFKLSSNRTNLGKNINKSTCSNYVRSWTNPWMNAPSRPREWR